MKLIKNGAFWGVLIAITGSLMLLQSLGLLATADLAWSAIFGGAGLVFLYVFFAGPDVYWWAAIPGFALLGLATLVAWTELGPRSADEWGGALFLGAIGLGFWAVYEVNHGRWWAVIPGGVLLTLALVAVLDPVLGDAASSGAFLLGLALTFVLLAVLPTGEGRMRWPLVPAAVLALVGVLVALGAAAVLDYAWPAALILAGLYLIFHTFVPGRSPERSLGRPSCKGG